MPYLFLTKIREFQTFNVSNKNQKFYLYFHFSCSFYNFPRDSYKKF